MIYKSIFIVLLTFPPFKLIAQKNNVDSLNQIINKTHKIDTNYINTLNKLSYSYYTVVPDSAIAIGKKALSLSKKYHFLRGIASASRFIGLGYNANANYKMALHYTFMSINYAQMLNDRIDLAAAYNNAGYIYQNKVNDKSAFYYYKLAINIYKDLNDKKGYANCLNNLGNVYSNQGNFPEALKNHLKAIPLEKN